MMTADHALQTRPHEERVADLHARRFTDEL